MPIVIISDCMFQRGSRGGEYRVPETVCGGGGEVRPGARLQQGLPQPRQHLQHTCESHTV